ncbi:MAG TPA: hypothetical protein VMF89_24025 [Polyangiales bacterium]|nr:hypothetical protein [Polyangiales bacterium]
MRNCLIISLGMLFVCPLSADAQDVEIGYNGGTTRLDNGDYGTWIENANHDYAVCGGETPFVSGISVNERGLWDNSARCSAFAEPIGAFDVPSYVAAPVPNPGTPGNFSKKVLYVSDCGSDGVVMGVAQPAGELAAAYGTPVLCGVPPAPVDACRMVEMPGDETSYAADAAEAGALDWTPYPAVTCGPGRYARGVAYGWYETGGPFVTKNSWAVRGLICCSVEPAISGPRETRWDGPQNP